MLEISEAVKKSGTYDVWMPSSEEGEVKDGLETVQPKKIKVGSRRLLTSIFLLIYTGTHY